MWRDVLRQGIEEARQDRALIADEIAYLIATRMHTGADTAMYYFAETGGIHEKKLVDEIRDELTRGRLDDEERDAVRYLGLYALANGDRPPPEDWELFS